MGFPSSDDARKRVVIVGACGGLGRATTVLLANSGMRLLLIDRLDAELESLRIEIETSTEVHTKSCSITDGPAVQAAFDSIGKRWGGIDAVVNVAGVFSYRPIADLSEAEWRRTVDINLTGMFIVCQAAIPLLAKSADAHIVNVLSIAATEAFENQAAYCASKAGGLAFTRVLMKELAPRGIAVTAINPGAVDTPIWNSAPSGIFDRSAMLQPAAVSRVIHQVLVQPSKDSSREIVLLPEGGFLQERS